MRNKLCVGAALLALAWTACAQGVPTEFPADAVPITGDTLKASVLGKSFVGKRADGLVVTMEFGADASFRVSAVANGRGNTQEGKVRVEGNTLCQDMRKTLDSGCNDVRLKENQLFYKRNVNGEVVTYTAQ